MASNMQSIFALRQRIVSEEQGFNNLLQFLSTVLEVRSTGVAYGARRRVKAQALLTKTHLCNLSGTRSCL